MKKNISHFLILIAFVFVSIAAKAQAEDPERVLKLSTKPESLEKYMKEKKWKKQEPFTDDNAEIYSLYRKKSFGGGYVYIAVLAGKYVHYQKFNEDKKSYSQVMNYEDFIDTPEGKTKMNSSMANKHNLIKNIALIDPNNNANENRFYGVMPK